VVTIPSLTFGEITIAEESVYDFAKAIPGLSGISKYAIIEMEDAAPFQWLQACESPYISMMMIDPLLINGDYKVNLSDQHLRSLGSFETEKVFYRSLVVVPEDPHQMTANLLAPLAFNPETGMALQVVIEGTPEMLRVKVLKD
jgi:flagellar assembly factor FliW